MDSLYVWMLLLLLQGKALLMLLWLLKSQEMALSKSKPQ